MLLLVKLCIRELKNHPWFNALFIINLSLGLSCFQVLDIFNSSLHQTLNEQSKKLLGADLVMSARRPLSSDEKKMMENIIFSESENISYKSAHMRELFSMISTVGNGKADEKETVSRLTHVLVLPKEYPYYGHFQLRKQGMVLTSFEGGLHTGPKIWISPELEISLGVQTGDRIQLGEHFFEVSDIVLDGPAGNMRSANMAPLVYVSSDRWKEGERQPPTRWGFFSIAYLLPDISNKALSRIRSFAFQELKDPGVVVTTHQSTSEAMARMSGFMNDFLSLAALSTLLLACVGMVFLFSTHVKSRLKSIALLMSLGMGKTQCFLLYMLQAQVLGFLSFLLSLGISLLLLPVLRALAKHWIPIHFDFNIFTFQWAFILSMLVPFFISLVTLNSLKNASFFQLLNEGFLPFVRKKGFLIVSFIGGALVIWLMAIGLSHSLILGTWFFVLFCASGFCLGLFAWGGVIFISFFANLFLSQYFRHTKLLYWMARDMRRSLLSYLTVFISLSMCILLLNLPHQMQESLAREINAPDKTSRLPSLFLFDIQDEQKENLKVLLKENKLQLRKIMPLVTARLLSLNGESFDKGQGIGSTSFTREKQREMHLRNRSFNLSEGLAQNLLKGEAFEDSYNAQTQKWPYISVEHRFAKRMGFQIGDLITFEIEGERLTGEVKNLRQVDWLSFQPNFFVLFQKNSLNPYTKTHVASLPSLPPENKNLIQNKIVSLFPNISLVDVTHVAKKTFGFTRQISLGFQMMSFLCLLAGMVVLFCISFWHGRGRKKDIGLLKALGMDLNNIRHLLLLPFIFISFFALVTGAGMSLLLSWIICVFVFLTPFYFDPVLPLLSIGLIGFLLWIIVHTALKDSLKTHGAYLLQAPQGG